NDDAVESFDEGGGGGDDEGVRLCDARDHLFAIQLAGAVDGLLQAGGTDGLFECRQCAAAATEDAAEAPGALGLEALHGGKEVEDALVLLDAGGVQERERAGAALGGGNGVEQLAGESGAGLDDRAGDAGAGDAANLPLALGRDAERCGGDVAPEPGVELEDKA